VSALRAAVSCALLLLGVSACRNQVVGVQNDSAESVNVSVAHGWSGTVTVPAGERGDLKARLRPGPVEVAIQTGRSSRALVCEYAEGAGRLDVRVEKSGKPECVPRASE
jgi:hypothetical protein